MATMLHKKIILDQKKLFKETPIFYIHGELIGWTDGETIIDCNDIKKKIEKKWVNEGPVSLANFMIGIVGPCVVEVKNNNEIWFFASCSSGGFYWMESHETDENKKGYFISNDEGRFLREVLNMGGQITNGALMNVILSHQSVIRAPFDGLVTKSKRLPPGFYAKFTSIDVETQCYLLNNKNIKRAKQDFILKKKLKAINEVYSSYIKIRKKKLRIAFSGGIDSTALLLNHKNILDKLSHGYYKDRGKKAEIKMAREIAKRAECNIDFVKPIENFNPLEIRRKAEKGLSIMNGLTYTKHGFTYSPYKNLNDNDLLVITGQNSDTLFHVDTFAPSSFTFGIIRLIKLSTSLILRFKTTTTYYKLQRFFNKRNRDKSLLLEIAKTYSSLSEHKTVDSDYPDELINIINDYKKNYYIEPFKEWMTKDFDKNLNNSSLSDAEKDNQIKRLARWIRTIGNFHQQFLNYSHNEKILICTPYSEGPIAYELLSYNLNVKDIFYPKLFLHNYIKSELGISYVNLRSKIFDDKLIHFPKQIIYYGFKYLKLKLTALLNSKYKKQNKILTKNNNIKLDDLKKLREIIGHKNGVVERILIKYVDDKSCLKYLNFLYDCIELKMEHQTLSDIQGAELCRMVNLHILIIAQDSSK